MFDFKNWYNNLDTHWFNELRKAKKLSNKLYYSMLDTDKSLYLYWKSNVKNEFPNMDISLKTYSKCLHGLMIYFYIASKEQNQTILPSLAADSVWHIWLAFDPKVLALFQIKHFGKALRHVEKKNMFNNEPEEYPQARTWIASCYLEDKNIMQPGLPILYKIDEELEMPGGWIYQYNKDLKKIGVIQIDANGNKLTKINYSNAFTAKTFLALGAITELEYSKYNTIKYKSTDSGSSGGGCGIGLNTYSSSSDSGDSGGSCGGGCGGD